MKTHTTNLEKHWNVSTNGQLTYFREGKVIFDFESETLSDKDKFYFLSLLPEIDEYEFLRKWVRACKAAKVKELIITTKK